MWRAHVIVLIVAALVPCLGCAPTQVANLCRTADARASSPREGDPFTTAQRIPGSRSSDPCVTGEHWACVHAPSEVRGLYARGGQNPCLAAIGDVRNGPNPTGPAEACPGWLPSLAVALYDDGRTTELRDAGHADACCYRFRYVVADCAGAGL